MNGIKFPYGRVVATKAVNDRMVTNRIFNSFCNICLKRHLIGDWGDLDKSDFKLNDEALRTGEGRLFSSYSFGNLTKVFNFDKNDKLWIITEADRSVTTLLFPSDY